MIMNETTITLGKNVYPIREEFLPQSKLKFYLDNPRVYSEFNRNLIDLTQEQIEENMVRLDHVRELKSSIEATGGLVEPIVVREGDFVVLEGNRRLAAYRILGKKGDPKWLNIRCRILPADISEEAIFILLGQYHLEGQLAWSPFEQAGYLYRRIEKTKMPLEKMAKELGLKTIDIKNYYKIYEFMFVNNDLEPNHWSYYEEYLKPRAIERKRVTLTGLDEAVVNGIKSGNIKDARKDIREKLVKIAKMPDSIGITTLEKFISGEKTLEQCHEDAERQGMDIINDLTNFRKKVSDIEITKVVRHLSDDERKRYLYELQTIEGKVNRLIFILKAQENSKINGEIVNSGE
jgi:hypothetical protein